MIVRIFDRFKRLKAEIIIHLGTNIVISESLQTEGIKSDCKAVLRCSRKRNSPCSDFKNNYNFNFNS